MRKFLLVAGGFAFCVLSFPLSSFAQDKIVAIVNNDVITQKDLEDFINFMRVQMFKEGKEGRAQKKIESMKPDLLDRLIEDRLILQEAKKNNIRVDENRIKARIAEIKKRYPSDIEFQRDLGRQGLVQADIEQKIREQLLMYYIIEYKIRSGILIRPEEVTAFYNENQKEFFIPEERGLDVITLENADLAASLSDNLRRGEKLEALAARYPLTVNKLSVRQGEDLRKEIQEVVSRLNLGEVSQPLKLDNDNAYYVFKLDYVIPQKQQSLFAAQEKIHAFLFDRKMQEGLNKWLGELKKQSYIKIIKD